MAFKVSQRGDQLLSDLAYRQCFIRNDSLKGQIRRDDAFAVFCSFDVLLAFLYVEGTITLGSKIRLLVEQDAHFLALWQWIVPCREQRRKMHSDRIRD